MLDSLILGIIQGLTEFIPVSSSGHLIIARELFHLDGSFGLAFDAVLQLATALAILVYFFGDIVKIFKTAYGVILRKNIDPEEKTLLYAVAIGTIPAVLLGIFLEDAMEGILRSTTVVALSLIAGSILFAAAEYVARQDRELSPLRGFWIGVFQSLALIPGMSRSGSTIAGGLFLGLSREKAAKFSFLLAFPIIVGSGLKKLIDLGVSGVLPDMGASLLVGSIAAFIVGLFAIHFLIRYLKHHSLGIFIAYRIVLAVLILTLL